MLRIFQNFRVKKKVVVFRHEKTYIFAHMSFKTWEGGRLKALLETSAKNVIFFYGSLKGLGGYWVYKNRQLAPD